MIRLMKHEYLERFKAWSNEEIEILKAKGATEDDLKEPAFNSLVVESVLEKHRDQILRHPEFAEEIFWTTF